MDGEVYQHSVPRRPRLCSNAKSILPRRRSSANASLEPLRPSIAVQVSGRHSLLLVSGLEVLELGSGVGPVQTKASRETRDGQPSSRRLKRSMMSTVRGLP